MDAEFPQDNIEALFADIVDPSNFFADPYILDEPDEELFPLSTTELASEIPHPMILHISDAEGEVGGHRNGEDSSDSDDDYAAGSDVIDVGDKQNSEERGFGDDEEVHIASESYKWKIDHTKGEHRLAATRFVEMANDAGFTGSQAIDMLQRSYTIDYGSRKAGSKAAPVSDEYIPVFHLDMLIVIGQPLKPITRTTERFFDNITITFKNWNRPYGGKHAEGLSFELEHRTFRIATAATRESWYIVMHPVAPEITDLPASKQESRKRKNKSLHNSALRAHHAQFLANYVKWIFLTAELLGEGVESLWKLGGPQAQNISSNKWTVFQEQFMDSWEDYIDAYTCDRFWTENRPAFHAYDYGANIQIKVNDVLQTLPRETRLQYENEESESDSGDDNGSDDGTSAHVQSASSSVRRIEGATMDGPEGVDYRRLYPEGLRQLRTEMEQKYVLDNIFSISYALAANINCLDASSPDSSNKFARCLLADRNVVLREYQSPRDFTFYPLAFHPAYGNFSSPQPPAFLMDNVLSVLRDNIRYQNNGIDAFGYGYFQGYSGIKSSIRHEPDSLLANKGIATAALTLPKEEADTNVPARTKRQRLLSVLRGGSTPDDPGASKPFMREGRRIRTAINGEEFAFRIEQVLTFQVSKLASTRRTFMTIFNPVFQLMRFFLQESERYTHLFRSFKPSIFPGILESFSNVFGLAIDEVRDRFEVEGSKGLGVALAEAVAALDRLGSYCFTGHPRSLMGSVLGPLGAIDGIKDGAWPYINPRVLDMRDGIGRLSVSQWPRSKSGRPILMHVASLGFHYGPTIAASRHSHVWFKEFSGMSIRGPRTMDKFLQELICDLWIPQTVAFVVHQFERAIRKEGQAAALHGKTLEQMQALEEKRSALQKWSESAHPFSAQEYEPLLALFIASQGSAANHILTKARYDFSSNLYASCNNDKGSAAMRSYCPPSATWGTILQAAIGHTSGSVANKDLWISAMSSAIQSQQIECLPGSYRAKLSAQRVIKLKGSSSLVAPSQCMRGSLKRKAIEAERIAAQPCKRRVIDFGCKIPFETVPEIIRTGFRSQEMLLRKGDQRVLEHYQLALICLEKCLGDPLCDLMLMMVLTLSCSSVTPAVGPNSHEFEAGKKKDPAIFAATMATRMLWFLRPEDFPWDEDRNSVLRVPEMTKKIEHKGVSNRVLRELGWVVVMQGNRDSPRNSDLRLESRSKLIQMRKELLSSRKHAEGFIGQIFHSYDKTWVDRCSLIIREKEVSVKSL